MSGNALFMDSLATAAPQPGGGYFDPNLDDFEQLVRDPDALDNGVVGLTAADLLSSSSSADIET
jgi:hypothetical protein